MRAISGIAAAGLALALAGGGTAAADTFSFRVASGHAPGTPYVVMMSEQFVPRIKAKLEALGHKVTFNEAYGGSLVKTAETMEGVQDAIVDIGGYCFCFEPANLFLNSYPLWMPFDMPNADGGLKLARAVYAEVPELAGAFGKYNQKLLWLFTFDSYGLFSSFPWKVLGDLKGHKLAGAGPNLPWIERAGAVPVQMPLPEMYQAIKTGITEGTLLPPAAGVPFKLYEAAPYFAKAGFGSKAFHGITVNTKKWDGLPPAVQKAILEAAKETEDFSAPWVDNKEASDLDAIRKGGGTVLEVAPEVKKAWAEVLADLPDLKAKEADAKGLPGSKTLRLAVDHAEKLGHKWPVRYVIK
ncbi:MAG: C4-dicarboxylate TRAP transporter substrate-binding protein [Alphaproteobacteria bacterium]